MKKDWIIYVRKDHLPSDYEDIIGYLQCVMHCTISSSPGPNFKYSAFVLHSEDNITLADAVYVAYELGGVVIG